MAMAKELLVLLLLVGCYGMSANAKKSGQRALIEAILNKNTTVVRLTRNVVLTSDLPPIPDNKLLTIIGMFKGGKGKVTIDGQGKYSIFKNSGTAPVYLELRNLIIKESTPNETIGAVNIGGEGSKVTILNVDFVDNSRAINFYIVNGIIKSSTFTNSRMTAIFLRSEEGLGDNVLITNSKFVKNRASTGFGGAAVYVDTYASTTIIGSQFIGNSVDYRGGAIRLRDAFGIIRGCTFTGNSANDQGGALTSFNSGLRVSNSLFQGNVAKGGPGGAVRVGAEDGEGSVGYFTNCTFINNVARKSGGGAFVLDTYSEISFCSSKFSGNTGPKGKANNGLVLGTVNTIYTYPVTKIPGVTVATGATVAYKTQKCYV